MVNKYNGAESPADKSPGESGRQDKPDSLVISEQDDGHDKQVHVLKLRPQQKFLKNVEFSKAKHFFYIIAVGPSVRNE